LKIERKENRGS